MSINFRKASRVLFVIAIIALIIFAVLIRYHSVLNLDVFLSRDLQSEGDTAARKTLIFQLMKFISFFGRTPVAVIMVLILSSAFWIIKYYREAFFCLLTPVAAVINSAIKLIVNRPRPSEAFVQILDRQLDPSFPSGHVTFYVVFFGYILTTMFFVKKIALWLRVLVQIICAGFIIAVGFSRVYLGAHWASDVIGGYLVGTILLSILLYFYLKKK